jgi:hypothetical protein
MKLHPNHRSKASNLGGDGRTLTYGRGSDGGAASEGLEAGVDDLAGALVDADLHLHDVAAGRRADQPGADVGVVLVEGSDVPWVVVVVHHPLVVRPHPGRHRRRARLAGAQAEPPEPRREEPSSSRAQHRPQTWSRLWILLFFFSTSGLDQFLLAFAHNRGRGLFLFLLRCGGGGIRCGSVA